MLICQKNNITIMQGSLVMACLAVNAYDSDEWTMAEVLEMQQVGTEVVLQLGLEPGIVINRYLSEIVPVSGQSYTGITRLEQTFLRLIRGGRA